MAELEPFATVEDLQKRWPDYPEDQQTLIEVLLEDASDFIREQCADTSKVSASTLRRITCSLVRRQLEVEDNGFGVESTQETAGPFTSSHRSVSPYGDFILSPRELKALGCGVQRAFAVDLMPEPHVVRHWWE